MNTKMKILSEWLKGEQIVLRS